MLLIRLFFVINRYSLIKKAERLIKINVNTGLNASFGNVDPPTVNINFSFPWILPGGVGIAWNGWNQYYNTRFQTSSY